MCIYIYVYITYIRIYMLSSVPASKGSCKTFLCKDRHTAKTDAYIPVVASVSQSSVCASIHIYIYRFIPASRSIQACTHDLDACVGPVYMQTCIYQQKHICSHLCSLCI